MVYADARFSLQKAIKNLAFAYGVSLMTETNTSELLDSVLELTSQRDQHSLRLWLVRSLQEFITADSIELYAISANTGCLLVELMVAVESPDHGSAPKQLKRLDPSAINDDPELMQCLATEAQVISTTQGNGGDKDNQSVRVIHPLAGASGVSGFLIIRCKSLIQRDQNLAAVFLKIYRNYMQLIDANVHDTLTGLLNRKTFSDHVMHILSRKQDIKRKTDDKAAGHKEYCLAMLDIDHFKKVNDKFGHLYGDEVLLLFARLMSKTFRDDDQVYRYGGEEFVVILKGANLETSISILDRFRKKVEAFHFPQVGNITISIGVVEIVNQDLPTTVVEQADKALYYAKDHGRNQVCAYEKLLTEGKLSHIQSQGEVELF